MQSLDLTAVIVVGALIGLLVAAFGYAQMVWLVRQTRLNTPVGVTPSTPALTVAFWLFVGLAGASLIQAFATRTLPDREALLSGEDLFSVRPRPGLIASYVASGPNVHEGEVLMRFTGQDGEEAKLALHSRRQVLAAELELESVRPLETDPELTRQFDLATSQLRELEQRDNALSSERDGIVREADQQRLAVDNRRFRVEQDDRAADRDLKLLDETLATQRHVVTSDEQLLTKGVGSTLAVRQERDSLSDLEGRRGELADRRAMFARERMEINELIAHADAAVKTQLASRDAERAVVAKDLEAAHARLDAAKKLLDQDHPRAALQRDKRLHQIQVQIDECDGLLTGRGLQAAAEAPWDGRIGFREPSPSSPPADNGPLLVMYHPGKLAVTVRLEPDEGDIANSDLAVDFRAIAATSAEATDESGEGHIGRADEVFAGQVVSRSTEQLGFVEVRAVVAPPDRLVRQLAMSGTVPVRARLKRQLTSMLGFRFAIGFAVIAFGFAITRMLRRRRLAPAVSGLPVLYDPMGAYYASYAAPPPRAAFVDVLPEQEDYESLQIIGLPSRPLLPPHIYPPQAPPPSTFVTPPGPRDPLYLTELGARLRYDIEAADLTPELVQEIGVALKTGGYPAAALIISGFGSTIEKQSVAKAAFGLLDKNLPEAGLGGAAQSCADFLRVMRTIGSQRMNGTIDQLRSGLVWAALAAAQRNGDSVEAAGILLQPLTEA